MDSTAESIADYHVWTLGWPGIGYHYIVHWDGQIEYVGDVKTQRANVAFRNHEVVGICIPGDWTEKQPPNLALDACRWLAHDHLLPQFPAAQIVGHRDIALDGTECPGASWERWAYRVRGHDR